MSIHKIECAYGIFSFPQHKKYKDQLLNIINSTPSNEFRDGDQSIDNTDWNLPENVSMQWMKFYAEHYMDDIGLAYEKMGYKDNRITTGNYWFQQYEKNSYHGFHMHGESTFSNVYFLELPEGTAATELISPYSGEIISVDAKEGDIVIFPAYIKHRAPINNTDNRRTVLVFNSLVE